MQHRPARPAAGSLARPGRLRALAPLITLLLPLALGAAAAAIWSSPCTGTCARPLAAVWVLAACAMPTGVLWGLPWTASSFTLGGTVLTSMLLWLLLGRWAAVRATRLNVDARWRHVLGELLPMLIGVWAGLLGGLGAVMFLFTR